MWKLLGGISLTLCLSAMAEGTAPKPFVSVECCGRLRHGVVAIGGETTGTTITFNRIIWELQLHNDAARKFATEHHKKSVVVTGALRKVAGVEKKVRWIIDVKKFSECGATKDKEGTRLSIQGRLQAADSRQDGSPRMTVVVGGHVWPLDLTSGGNLQSTAAALVGHSVLLTGHLEQVTKKRPDATTVFVRVKTLQRAESTPLPGRHN